MSKKMKNRDYIRDAFLDGREYVFINELPHPETVPQSVRRGLFGAPVLAREGTRLILLDPDDESNIQSL